MEEINRLDAIQNQTLSQMTMNEDINSHFSPGLVNAIKKIGIAAFVSTLALSSQMAHANDTLKGMLGIAVLTGMATNGNNSAPNGNGYNNAQIITSNSNNNNDYNNNDAYNRTHNPNYRSGGYQSNQTYVQQNSQPIQNNQVYDCENTVNPNNGVSGTNVAIYTAGGAGIGSLGGGGTGKTVLTVLGGLIGGVTGYNVEKTKTQDRNRVDCYRANAELGARNVPVRNVSYNNGQDYNASSHDPNYYNGGSHNAPAYANNAQSSLSPVLYTYRSNKNGANVAVSMANSAGVSALQGVRDGAVSPNSNPQIANTINKSLTGLANSYDAFETASQEYIRVAQGVNEDNKNSWYSNSGSSSNENQRRLETAARNWDSAFNRWTRERAGYVATLDTAVLVGNIQISSYGRSLQLLNPPQSANKACNCDLIQENRSSTVPEQLTKYR